MKQFSAFALMILMGYVLGLFTFLPWYSFVVSTFLICWTFNLKPIWALVLSFFSMLTLWAVLAIYIDVQNEHLLSKKVAEILPLGGSSNVVIAVTSFVGGLLNGLSGWSAALLRKAK